METVVAKKLYGIDEKGYMYPHSTLRPDVCPVCKNRIRDVPNLEYKVKKKQSDLLLTYDHYYIVSQRFKDFCNKNNYEGLDFIELHGSKGFYHFMVNKIYELDYERRKTQFINYRNCCNSYDEVIGSVPSFKKENFSVGTEDFIYRTEFRFASYAFKHYCLIIGLETMGKMKLEKIKGIYFDNVFQ